MTRTNASTFTLLTIALSILGCGARTEFGDLVDDSVSSAPSTLDRCPSAVQPGAPKAMTGNCSTRDGRTRAAAPSAPHIRWTAHLPIRSGQSNSLEITGLVTDASGNAFLSSFEGYGNPPTLRKIDRQGNISWVTNFNQGPTPFLMVDDSLLLFGGPPVVVSRVDPESGSSSSIGVFGFEHRNVQDPAIGRDGSIYFVHEIGANAQDLAVSRANTDGSIVWTSKGLSALLGTTGIGLDISEVALGNDDQVFIAMSLRDASVGKTIVYAFDPSTGEVSWTQTLKGTRSSDVRVRPDGSIVVSHQSSPPFSPLAIIAPTGEIVHDWFPKVNAQTLAVATNGDLLISDGFSLMGASATDGHLFWTKSRSFVSATITTDGFVIASTDSTISAIDFSSGDVAWTIAAPNTESCLLGSTLTSDSTVIGVQCDGTVFGASD